ncbi:branched-chain amino acid aminotransferase/4-amino-4-deoxychorismate lyase [Frankia sp. EI5c]|uniref:aminotransferase class IV n=1 Tax=Frankia sp. EI5c TaxID=683316 RepID=UPI0007C35069|nr:aminotransferase class IV [Frankia sp. EI5c]OAA29215.1 branched-chain amino acid aminotransferase/4-amino-4-deoxychorismate lyase [Frankia sp. EI5c]
METTPQPYVEVDGRPAAAGDLRPLALANDGHLTTMQVRAGKVRGLALHLRRLDDANRELYGTGLDEELLRARIRHALAAWPDPGAAGHGGDATVRVVVFPAGGHGSGATGGGEVCVLVSAGPPAEPPAAPLRLCSVRPERPFAHLKHIGTFGQIHGGRVARRRGFDDALLVTADGLVCETTIANIGFVDAPADGAQGPATVVWPAAPALRGVTMTLLHERLRTPAGAPPASPPPRRPPSLESDPPLESVREPVRLADTARFRAAFVTNSRGLAAVERIDTTTFSPAPAVMAALRRVHTAVPWDEI